MMNMWAPDVHAHTEDWSAGRNDSTMPWYAKADWVEYYSWDSESDTFKLEWRDDFDWLDTGRWSIGDNQAWDGNLARFMSS